MANVIVNDSNLTAIADAIREKNGETTTYKPSEMAAAITNLPSGGGGGGSLAYADISYSDSNQYGGWREWDISNYLDNPVIWVITQYNNYLYTTIIENGVIVQSYRNGSGMLIGSSIAGWTYPEITLTNGVLRHLDSNTAYVKNYCTVIYTA